MHEIPQVRGTSLTDCLILFVVLLLCVLVLLLTISAYAVLLVLLKLGADTPGVFSLAGFFDAIHR